YLQVILLCLVKILTATDSARGWRAGYVGMVTFMALGFCTWLNFYCFLLAAGTFLYAFYWRHGGRTQLAGIRFVLLSTTALLAIWMPVKLFTSQQHFTPGREDEVILCYRRPIFAI